MRALLILNPKSRGGKGKRLWPTLFAELNRQGIEWRGVEWTSVQNTVDTIRSVSDVDAVLAVGGDGTINSAVAGTLQNPNPKLRFGVLYAGTSPDFCRFHGLPTDIQAAVKAVVNGKARNVDVLELTRCEPGQYPAASDSDTTTNPEYVCCSCNLGMGAEVAATANRLRPRLGDAAGTFCALIRSLIRNKRYSYCVNGERIENCNHLLVTKMPYIASGIKISVDLGEDDRQFVLCYLQNLSFFGWLRLIPRIYRGASVGTIRLLSQPLEISSVTGAPISVEYDGDPQGTLPIRIGICPRPLRLIVP